MGRSDLPDGRVLDHLIQSVYFCLQTTEMIIFCAVIVFVRRGAEWIETVDCKQAICDVVPGDKAGGEDFDISSREEIVNEGPGCATPLAGARFHPRATDREPSSVDGCCGRTSKTGHRRGSGRRRHPIRDLGGDPASIRFAAAAVPLSRDGHSWTKDEAMRPLSTEKALEQRHDQELDADMPRGTAGKESCPFLRR